MHYYQEYPVIYSVKYLFCWEIFLASIFYRTEQLWKIFLCYFKKYWIGTWKNTNFCELWWRIKYWRVFILAGNVLLTMIFGFSQLADKKIKILLWRIILHRFKLIIKSFHTKMSNLKPTSKIRSLGTPVLCKLFKELGIRNPLSENT